MSLLDVLGAGFLLLLAIPACIGISRASGERLRGPLPRRLPSPRYPETPPLAAAYSVFTTAFDVECSGTELERVLSRKALDRRASRHAGVPNRAERHRQFDDAYALAAAERAGLSDGLSDTAVMVLLDQSGSMADCMPRVAGALLAALESLETAGATTVLAGFTTLGWKGGRARRQWLRQGRPPHPGRLCDLLHVVYSAPHQATRRGHLLPLVGRAICFENVDGEAIAWAEQQLLALPRRHRCLVVVSDGAPVDDSTLMENGNDFLWDDLIRTIADVGARGQIALGAVGIDHRVETVYPYCRMVAGDAGLAAAVLELVNELARDLPATPHIK
jgi:cobaltochelatase CobT